MKPIPIGWILPALLLLAETGAPRADSETGPPPLAAGAEAPDFTLKDQSYEDVSLSSFRGKKTILAFYVFAFTGG